LLSKLNGLDLFSGIGGLTLALREWVKPIAYCEIEPYCQSVLLQRMQEGNLPHAPIWDDIRKLSRDVLFDAGIISYPIDIIYGGFPCQEISIAGTQKGLEGERSSLFFEISRLIHEIQPSFIFLENVPNIRTKGAERVCKELAERGYDSRWCCVSASDVGATHKRERWFLLAYAPSERCQTGGFSCNEEEEFTLPIGSIEYDCRHKGWKDESPVARMAYGIPHRVDRIKALGNAVVPQQVKKAFELLLNL